MDFLELTKQRFSVRAYSSKKVEQEKLDKILKAGGNAPTAHNNQPQKIYIIQSENAINKLKMSTRYTFEANCFLLITYDENLSWYGKGNKEGAVDAAIVATHMMLEAQELGLGTLWVGAFDRDIIKKEFDLPKYIIPVCILLIGYSANDAKPSVMHFARKEIKETVEYL